MGGGTKERAPGPFYLNLGFPKIEGYAAKHGLWGGRWKDAVLEDLLHDGHLWVVRSFDPRDAKKVVWHCAGRKVSVFAVADSDRADTLFCIGLVAGPASGRSTPNGPMFPVSGPWRVQTFKRRTEVVDSVVDHISRCEKMGIVVAAALVSRSTRPNVAVVGASEASVARAPTASNVRSALDEVPTQAPVVTPFTEELVSADIVPTTDRMAHAPTESELSVAMVEPMLAFTDLEHHASLTGGSWLEIGRNTIQLVAPEMRGLLDVTDVASARRQRIARLEAEIERLRSELDLVPGEAQLLAATDLLRRTVDTAASVLATPPPRVETRGPEGLLKVLEALAVGVHEALPPWAMGATGTPEPEQVLASSDLQVRLLCGAEWIHQRFAGAPPSALRGMEPVGDDAIMSTSLAEALSAAWAEEEALLEVVKDLPRQIVTVLRGVPREEALQIAADLQVWRSCLHELAFAEFVERIAAAELFGGRRCPPAPSRRQLGATVLESLTYIPKWTLAYDLVRQRPSAEELPLEVALLGRSALPEPPAGIVEFTHVVTDDRGYIISAALLIPEPPKDVSYCLVEVPVRLYAIAPIVEDCVVTVRSAEFAGVPTDAILGTGIRVEADDRARRIRWVLEGDESRWRRIEGPGRYEREERVPVAFTRGTAARLRDKGSGVTITFRIGDVTNSLRFDRIEPELPAVLLRKATGTEDASFSDLVRNRPLGPQVWHRKLEGVVEEGRHSFMVVAPRRFGKTTLLQHLAVHAKGKKHQVVHVTLAREVSTTQAVIEVWREILDTLANEHDVRPSVNEPPSSLINVDSWVKVRRFLHDRGCTKLVLLIDEAQALVPRAGSRWGTDLKNFIERHLVNPEPGLATVQIGLFGTVDLGVRVGQNCRDFLITHGAEQFAFDETSLARYLREVGQGSIQSSRAARVELAYWANNLHTLLELFGHVQRRLETQRRLFMLDSDVTAAVLELLDPARPSSSNTWQYARAELSHHDEWDPVDSLPLALAWALADPAMLATERLLWCVRWLHEQLRTDDTDQILPERVDAALRDLKSRGVLRDDGKFYRPLLAELLRRQPRLLIDDTKSRLALLRLAVDVVDWPSHAEPRDEGAQAVIFVAEQGGRTRAFRICKVDDDATRRRFARTCAALRRIRDQRTRIDGDEHLPRLSQAGFRSDDGSVGVVVYDWVEGQSLEHMWSTLDRDARIFVVKQVARGVDALHRRGVIHCDIAPRNVIVDGSLKAVLIDFGLARLADVTTSTRLAPGPFTAPEQFADPPSSDTASDVFALGMLLAGPLGGKDLEPDQRRLCETMTAQDAADRPSLPDVLGVLEAWDFRSREPVHKKRVEDAINDLPEWLWEDLLSFVPMVTFVLDGNLPWDEQRAMATADLLNRVFVTALQKQIGPVATALASLSPDVELSLAAVGSVLAEAGRPDRELARWKSPEVHAIGLLRNAWAHPKTRKQKIRDARRSLKASVEEQSSAFRRAALRVATMMGTLWQDKVDAMGAFVKLAVGDDHSPVAGERRAGARRP